MLPIMYVEACLRTIQKWKDKYIRRRGQIALWVVVVMGRVRGRVVYGSVVIHWIGALQVCRLS
jgi:hypothetical protein